jgi:hypothetical protein
MPLILGANSASGGYNVANSLRFNSGSSDSLTRTPATTGTSRRIMTFSFWTKRSGFETTNAYRLFSTFYGGGASQFWIRFADSGEGINRISIVSYDSGFSINLITTQVFTDPSAWYHFVIAFDTTQGTSSNRVKVYVNGSQITSFATSTYPSQNYDIQWNVTQPNQIGANAVSGNEFYNGYMSEIYMIDGQQLTPSSFGETDTLTGIWKPKAYTGSFGTNGFYLKFANSAALGTDSSGNGNTFTVNNLTSIDQTTDTPTNNFCTMNPLNSTNSCLLTEGNLKQAQSSNDQVSNGTIGFNKGKWYWEFKMVSGLGEGGIVLNTNKTYYSSRATADLTTNDTCIGRIFNATGSTNNMRIMGSLGSSTVGASVTYSAGDIVSVAVDADAGKIWFAKNGTYEGSGNPATGSNPTYDWSSNLSSVDFITAIYGIFSGTSPSAELNFGNPIYSSGSNADGAGFGNFSYAVPSGYYSLNTKNLADYG